MNDAATPGEGLSPIKRAFLMVEEAERKLAARDAADREPIAVIGMGCRVPGGGDSPAAFWRLLESGTDAVGEVPGDRWDHDALFDPDPDAPGRISTRYGGFLGSVDRFDPDFFGIAPREAQSLDPQQRLLLEVCWETLEHAGQPADRLAGSDTGIFMGAAGSDYAYLQMRTGDPSLLDAHFASGIAHSTLTGRLSYLLGLQGPSVTLDTACSSSLVAIHLAAQALRAGDCRLALAGGVNLILGPEIFIALSQARMLSPDGRCKAFADGADGFGRAEGCGVVALKRLSHAEADGDRILALIRGSAVNQDGASSGLTAPNGPAQEAVMRAALARAGLAPENVGYVEAHGTGTSLGDPIEAGALGAVFGRGRAEPLPVGSVKSNLGHLEAAAGVTSVIKLVLALQNKTIPPSLHADTPSSLIDWDRLGITVASSARDWPETGGPRIAGTSSFGFSGTNAHVLLQEAPEPTAAAEPTGPALLALSAATEPALKDLAAAYDRALGDPSTDLHAFAATASAGRSQLARRATVTGDTREAMREAHRALSRGEDAPGLTRATAARRDPPKTAFLYTGQGAQYAGMGKGLYDSEPVFRDAIDACAKVLDPLLGTPLLDLLYGEAGDRIGQTGNAQPALFAVEYALTRLWASLGVKPDVVAGHSLGEIVAAHVAGVFSLEDALKLVAARGRLMQALPTGGAMASVFAPEDAVAGVLSGINGVIGIAAVNGATQTVVSGAAEAVDAACAAFDARGISSQRLVVSHAFHSALMDPALDAFEAEIAGIEMRRPRLRLISNLTGEPATADIATPGYWRRHMREAVRFRDCLQSIGRTDVGLVLEIGPHAALLPMAREALTDPKLSFGVSLRRGKDDRTMWAEALSAAWLAGAKLDWKAAFGPASRIVDVPTYPFQRDRYWFRTARRKAETGGTGHPLLGRAVPVALRGHRIFEQRMLAGDVDFIADHVVRGRIIVPGAALIDMALSAAGLVQAGRAVADMTLTEPLALDDEAETLVQTVITQGDAGDSFEILSLRDGSDDWRRHASGRLVAMGRAPEAPAEATGDSAVTGADHYADLAARGLTFGPSLRRVERIERLAATEALGHIDGAVANGAHAFQPALLDACLQIIAGALPDTVPGDAAYMPFAFGRVSVFRAPEGPLTVRARTEGTGQTLSAHVTVMDGAGVIAELADIVMRPAQSVPSDALYTVAWERLATPAALPAPSDLNAEAKARLDALATQNDLPRYDAAAGDLDALSRLWMADAFRAMGWEPAMGETVELKPLAARLDMPERLHGAVKRYLDIFTESGHLEATGSGWTVRQAFPTGDAEALSDEVLAAHPDARAKVEMVRNCGRNLAAILQGTRNPVEDLFPGGDLTLARELYRYSPEAQTFNRLIAETVQRLSDIRRPLRILEIGGGSGGTTDHVLTALQGRDFDYTFTDIGGALVARASEEFAGRGRMQFRTLDLEDEPGAQGFADGAYDIVIGANVVHATADLGQTASRIRNLLSPGGMALILEVTEPEIWVDVTFGLTEGWWLFTDRDLRPEYPLIETADWLNLFADTGFEAAPLGGRHPNSRQMIFAALKPLDTGLLAGTEWVVLGDGDTGLDAQGATVKTGLAAVGPKTTGILDLRALGAGAAAADAEPVLSQMRETVQALARADLGAVPPRYVAVTSLAQMVEPEDLSQPAQAGVWGLFRSLRLEFPEWRPSVIDLGRTRDGEPDYADLPATLASLGRETEIAVRDGTRHAARLDPAELTPVKAESLRLMKSPDGILSNLALAPFTRPEPGPGEVVIEVRAAGLNLRDVMNALDMRDDPEPLGGECAGVVRAVGDGVTGIAPGQMVSAVAEGCFGTYALARAGEVAPIPSGLSPAEAATLPFAYMTARWSLIDKGGLQAGEWVLIHAAAGGVGSAAVQVAQAAGARIIATAGSEAKRALLRAQGVEHVFNSRDTDFAAQVMTVTDGHGADVALNSLSGDFIDATVECLAETGRLVEIGKRDLWTHDDFAQARPKGAYHIVDLAQVRTDEPELSSQIFRATMEDAAAGRIRPLPLTTFPMEKAGEAFEYMAQARHVGKVVLVPGPAEPRSLDTPRSDTTYLVTGGTRGLGLLAAETLVGSGARHIVLAGRSAPSEDAARAIEALREKGATVEVRQADVADAKAVAAIFEEIDSDMPPLAGVIHSAGRLSDGSLMQMNREAFAVPLGPKVDGSWALHRATLDRSLDFFVLFSSVAGTLGSTGQANHSAANAYMDALAAHRRALGLPATSIAWGAWSETGIAAETTVDRSAEKKGILPITDAAGLQLLKAAMESGAPTVMACPVDWTAFAGHRADLDTTPFFARVAQRKAAPKPSAPVREAPSSLAADLEAASPADRARLLLDFIAAQVAATLDIGSPDDIDIDRPLREMGLDSLMAVDLRNKLSAGLGGGESLPATLVFDHPTVSALVDGLSARLAPKEEASATPEPDADPDLDSMTEEEIEALFAASTGDPS